ncbi:MAG: hypothetical protein LBT51_01410 [Fusobacteriaceae bacterium]|jgi:hypothetical protein|nr:hypothetical protein [Fusobacteriaceae bacterium]
MDKLLGNYSIEELQSKIEIPEDLYKPFLLVGDKYYHEYKEVKPIPGEEFVYFPEYDEIKVSNFGRIIYHNEILHQESRSKKDYDYLCVKIPEYRFPILVYKLVAETFLLKDNPDPSKYNIIHHISNNGFDNRVINLIYVTSEQHKEIHNLKK